MAMTLGSIVLPEGLRWSDEHAWSPVAQATEYSLSGALIVEEATRQAGRPITLQGGVNFSWLPKEDLDALAAALDAAPSTGLTLTLYDAREFQVMPIHPALTADSLPLVLDSGVSDPTADTTYYISEIRLMEI